MEFHKGRLGDAFDEYEDLPPVKVIISDAENNEDVVIKVSVRTPPTPDINHKLPIQNIW